MCVPFQKNLSIRTRTFYRPLNPNEIPVVPCSRKIMASLARCLRGLDGNDSKQRKRIVVQPRANQTASPMKKLRTRLTAYSFATCALAILLCLTPELRAQISVNQGANPTITFDGTTTLTLDQWGSFTNFAGKASAWTTPAAVDAGMQAVDTNNFFGTKWMAIPRVTAYSTVRAASHNTAAGLVFFDPTGYPGCNLIATLRNTSGAALSGLGISYDYSVPGGIPNGGSEPNEAPGLRVYYS